jgi:hypothetical protein
MATEMPISFRTHADGRTIKARRLPLWDLSAATGMERRLGLVTACPQSATLQ